MAGRTFPIAVRTVALLVCVALADACGGSTPPPPPPVHFTVDGTTHQVPPGTSFGTAIADLGLNARDGRLLSVSGAVLKRYQDLGQVLLNGTHTRLTVDLAEGDRITVVEGHDRTEGTRRLVADIGRRVGNPERTLATYPTKRITVSGRVSGEIVSVVDVSIGHGRTPHSVALTFDDGPWPVHTERVLKVLKRFHVPATFFMVGYQVSATPSWFARSCERARRSAITRSIIRSRPPLADLPQDKIMPRDRRRRSPVLGHDGTRPTLFRPPGGSYDDFVVQEARRQGMRVVLWSVDPRIGVRRDRRSR